MELLSITAAQAGVLGSIIAALVGTILYGFRLVYIGRLVPKSTIDDARTDAAKAIQDARDDRDARVAEANDDADQWRQFWEQERQAHELTRRAHDEERRTDMRAAAEAAQIAASLLQTINARQIEAGHDA